jgi:hypothetical protein
MPEQRFDEGTFVTALTMREEDAKRFSQIFHPSWLKNRELEPILQEIYSFTKEYSVPPTLETLSTVLHDKNPELYDNRYKRAIEYLRSQQPSLSEQLYVLGRAQDAAIIYSLQDLVNSQNFIEYQTELAGKGVLNNLNKWMNQFLSISDEETCDIKYAVEDLMRNRGLHRKFEKISTGIEPIDMFCGGGLRPENLGIILAPTGHGKSATLLNIAYKVANSGEDNVWFFTNELSMYEQTERFLARMTGVDMKLIQHDPAYAHEGLGNYWKNHLHERLWLTAVNKDVTANEIEATMVRNAQITGRMPRLLCLDYMERMKPNESGYDRKQSWTWFGAVARDLIRLAKRHNLLIWTAAQSNRAGLLSPDGPGLENVQGSIQHVQESAAVISQKEMYIRKDADGNEVRGFSFIDRKMRHSKRTEKAQIYEVNMSTMYISSTKVEVQTVENEKEDLNVKSVKRNGK